jgi:hypothetical protein
MIKILVALALALMTPFTATALPATCLPSPLPATPIPPTFTLEMFFFSDHARGTIWRQACQDGSGQVAVLIRLTAVTANPFVCSVNALIVQGGIQRDGTLATSTSGFPTVCGDLLVPTTVVLLSSVAQPDFDETAAFTLIYDGTAATSVEIPAAAPPPPAGLPTVIVVATGCTTCHPGDILTFQMLITNPGAPMLVELKTGARLPGGAVVSILGRHEAEIIGSGVTVIPLFALVLPAGIPAGAYAIEAALLEPELGVTLSRSSLPVTLLP